MVRKSVIDTNEVRGRLGDLVNRAHYRGEEFVVQRRGKPLVAIISYEAYERLQQKRAEALRVFQEIWDANTRVNPKEVAASVNQAVEEVRSAHRRRNAAKRR